MNTESPLPEQGDVVAGKYRIGAVIGAGGMGVVMSAVDESLGRAVAIKFLSPAKATREDARERFLREARAAASIQSEHVVRVFEVGTLPSGASFIVMEHLRGADLAQTLSARGPLPIDEAVDYVIQACEAIGEAHGRGIVHRDLKPQNLFLTQKPDGSPCTKVLDFGISKAQGDAAPNLTATETVMGTPLYMSPEQVRSLKNVDHRADIWALGSILFELLTASPIFDAPSATALCAMIAMDPPTPLRARRADAPAELEAAILRCLHKDPNGRFADVGALADALAPFASERGRLAAERVGRVVRAVAPTTLASGPPAAPPADAPTAAGTTATVRGAVASGPPPNVPTTESTWQHTGELAPPPGRSPVVLAVLGVLAGLAVLGVAGTVGYVVVTKPVDEQRLSPATTTASSVPAVTVAAIPPAASSLTIAPPPQPVTSSSAAAAASHPVAPSSPKDAGAAPAPKNDDLEAKKRAHTAFCSHNRFLLSQPNVTDATLRQVETSSCLPGNTPDGARCERDNCRSACLLLKDQMCLQRVDFADQSLPAKY